MVSPLKRGWGVWIGRTLYAILESKDDAIAFAVEMRFLVPARREEVVVRGADAAEIERRNAKLSDA